MIIAAVVLVILIFGMVVLVGAPYLPTLSRQSQAALDLLDLKPGEILLDLGSGDGRVMKAAAKRGLNVVGYELNPILVLISYFVTLRYRKKVKIIWGNFWRAKWPPSDGAFIFLLDKYMAKLDKKIENSQNRPSKLASFTFEIPGKKPKKSRSGVYLYTYR